MLIMSKIILAVYYTLADIVLLCQCFYYRGFTLRDNVTKPDSSQANERTALLAANDNLSRHDHALEHRHNSVTSWSSIDGTHLSPVTPLIDTLRDSEQIIT